MALDWHYIPAFSIEDVLLDKDTGAPLSGGKVYFERDSQRGTQKPIYQITGTSPDYTYIQLTNYPLILSSIGTFQDSLGNPIVPYFKPYVADTDEIDLYYIEVTSSGDVPQFDREAVPYIADTGVGPTPGPVAIENAFTNQISNPQFSQVLFDTSTSSYVYSFNAVSQKVVQIAPGWDIVVTAPVAATVTVKLINPVGSFNLPTNPGTILDITSAGVTRLRLRQRIFGSPNLFSSGYLSASFVAKTFSSSIVDLTLYYSQSDGLVVDLPIVVASLQADGIYRAFSGSVLIPPSTSTQNVPNAYVDIEFDIPPSIEIGLTSVMISATGLASVPGIVFQQTSLGAQITQLFPFYQTSLNFKPISSMLTGWDFPLNPAQPFGSSVTFSTTAGYIWDQTICQSVVGNVAVVRSAVTGGFQATNANAAEAFYQIQYLTGAEARKILGTTLSVNVNAFRSQTGGVVNAKVYLYAGRSAAVVPILPTSLGTMDALGVFTLTGANWTLIPRGNLGQASGSLSTVDTTNYTTMNDVVDLAFNGWEIIDTAQIADTDKFAIVVTYSCPTASTVVTIDSVSVVPGDIATRPAPQTADEVLRECQYYFESSYPPGVAVGTSYAFNTQFVLQNSINGRADNLTAVYASPFTITFNTPKRTGSASSPLVTLYTPAGSANSVIAYLYYALVSTSAFTVVPSGNLAVSTYWTAEASNKDKSIYFVPILAAPLATASNGSSSAAYSSGGILFHYFIDARLGVVV